MAGTSSAIHEPGSGVELTGPAGGSSDRPAATTTSNSDYPNSSYVAFADEHSNQSEKSMNSADMRQVERTKNIVTGCYIAIFAIFGTFVRITIAQLFGEACANPGSVGWIAASAPLCVTKDGDTLQEGGIVFADLPSNLLGSFIMGFFQNSAVLGLAVPMALGWLSRDSSFQSMSILHKGITTGFCGSLTTYSSWNSEMIVVMFGTGNGKATAVWSAIFGYIIGMETAIGSFAAGKSFAKRLHRMSNPGLHKEKKAQEERRLEGIYLHPDLPDFERRFLAQLNMGDDYNPLSDLPVSFSSRWDTLERWRSTTVEARRVGSRHLNTLIDIETATLIHHRATLSSATETVARNEGWDVDSLVKWMQQRQIAASVDGSGNNENTTTTSDSILFSLPFAAAVLTLMLVFLATLVAVLKDETTASTITYRTMAYAGLFAPLGALLRWKLSSWNSGGTFLPSDWAWLPAGTWTANVLGSAVSIAAVAWEYRRERTVQDFRFAHVGTLRAIKVGFAGCLTTVSTFVAEISGFMQQSGNDKAYPYILSTLGTTCLLASVLYASIIFI